MVTLSAGFGPYGLTGKIYVDEDVLRIVEHGVSLEIPYADLVEAKAGSLMTSLTLRTKAGLHRRLMLFSPFGYKKVAQEIRRKAGLSKN